MRADWLGLDKGKGMVSGQKSASGKVSGRRDTCIVVGVPTVYSALLVGVCRVQPETEALRIPVSTFGC